MSDRWAAIDDSIRRGRIQNRITDAAIVGLYAVQYAIFAAGAVVIIRLALAH